MQYNIKIDAAGVAVAIPIEEGTPIPLSMLGNTVNVYRHESFTVGGRHFSVSLYTKEDSMIYKIAVDKLRWKLPLVQNSNGEYEVLQRVTFDVDYYEGEELERKKQEQADRDKEIEEKAEETKFYMENVTIFYKVDHGEPKILIANNDCKLFQMTNIFDDGIMCHGLEGLSYLTSPRELIIMIENSIGNKDLSGEIEFDRVENGVGILKKRERDRYLPKEFVALK